MISSNRKKILLKILMPYHPKRVGIFGSYARNEQTKKSDLDVLVDFEQTINLFDLVGLEMDLSEELGIKVDLVTENAVNQALRPYIERDLKWIFG
jgi:uncharacterized protein